MTYRVISTQTYDDPINEWSIVAEFEREDDAQAFAIGHYETQTQREENYNPATDCLCETCSGGWRVVYWKNLVVHVVEV